MDLFSKEMEERFKQEGKIYRRKTEPLRKAEQAIKPTMVETKLPDSTIETTQEAQHGDWIVTGAMGEQMVFTNEKFHRLYHSNNEKKWIPRERTIITLQNPFGKHVRISAPWATPEKPAFQDGSREAVFVAELSSEGEMTNDRYIIANKEFLLKNYEPTEAKI